MKGALVAWSWNRMADRLCNPLCYWRARLKAVMSLKLFIFHVQVQRLVLIRSEEFLQGIVGCMALCSQHLQARQGRVCSSRSFDSRFALSPRMHATVFTLVSSFPLLARVLLTFISPVLPFYSILISQFYALKTQTAVQLFKQ